MNDLIFLKEFLNKEAPFPSIKNISYRDYSINEITATENAFPKGIMVIRDIPGYLDIDLFESTAKILKIISMQGYYVDLSKFSDYSSYLESVQGSRSRSNLRRYTLRLEDCFSIRYVVYYGNINKEEYHRLFETLRLMLERRFEEKKESNYELPHLQEIQDSLYNLILEKQGSLFVIYDGDKPISIRINMFKGPLAYYILSGYDIDYSKFHPGLVDMAKNIEWLYQNDFMIYDLLKGYKRYKSKWYTNSYQMCHYGILHKYSFFNFLNYLFILSTLQLKESILRLIRFLRLNSLGKNFYRYMGSLTEYMKNSPQLIKVSETEKEALFSNMSAVDIEVNNEYQHIKRYVYDTLFTSKWVYKKTLIYKHRELPVFCLQNENDRIFFQFK